MRVGVVVIMCWLVGVVFAGDPPEPRWPNEVTMTFASDDTQFFVNYSYASQKIFIDYDCTDCDRWQLYVDCHQNLYYSYWGDESIAQVCYDEPDDFDEFICPLPNNPFHFIVGTNLTYNGQTTLEGQQVYVWMNGYDDHFYNPCRFDCTFYWETASYSTTFRTPIAATFLVDDLDEPPFAGYFQNFFSPLLDNSQAKQTVNPLPDIPCHADNPPLLFDDKKKETLPLSSFSSSPLSRLVLKMKEKKERRDRFLSGKEKENEKEEKQKEKQKETKRGDPPPQPLWPNEVTMRYAGDFQFYLNYSYTNQKTFVDFASGDSKFQWYTDCNENQFDSYFGDPDIGQVCYSEEASDFDDYLCPLPSNPFHYIMGLNMTYNGQTSFEGQNVYVWMEGYDPYFQECEFGECAFYWETASYSPEYRTPIASNFDVENPEDPRSFAGYYFNFSTPLLQDSSATQEVTPIQDLPCHPYFPPFYPPNDAKKEITSSTKPPFLRIIEKLKVRQ